MPMPMAYIRDTQEINPTPMTAPESPEQRTLEDVLLEAEAIIWADQGLSPAEMQALGDFFMRTLERARSAGGPGGPPQPGNPVAAPGLPAPNAEDMFSDEREGAAPLDLL